MPPDFLHNHPEFGELIRIVAEEKRIDPALVEKDYWIMHCLYGLQQLGLKFQLKGGTSLSKGHNIIGRFSEDIDILIEPPAGRDGAPSVDSNILPTDGDFLHREVWGQAACTSRSCSTPSSAWGARIFTRKNQPTPSSM